MADVATEMLQEPRMADLDTATADPLEAQDMVADVELETVLH